MNVARQVKLINHDHNYHEVTSRVKDEAVEDKWGDSPSKRVHGSEEHKRQGNRCDKCLKVYKSEYYRNKHIQLVHGTGSHKCAQCNKEFKCKEYLTKHVNDTHSKRQYECDNCKKLCKTKEALRRHITMFHRDGSAGSSSKFYICYKCQQVFQSEVCLNQHIEQVHEIECHKCTQCHKEFNCKRYLSRHIQYAHSKEQYECNLCKRMYKSQIALRYHVSKYHRNRSADLDMRQVNRDAAAPSMVSSANMAACSADQCGGLTIKQESGDTDLDIGPTVLQHVDSHCIFNKVKVEHVKMESSPLMDEHAVKKEPDLPVEEDNAGV